MLEGKQVNLRVVEKEDLKIYQQWFNDINFQGEFLFTRQQSLAETEKRMFSDFSENWATFVIEKKDGTRIGLVLQFTSNLAFQNVVEIGCLIKQEERGKGYSTEAVEIIVDYLFLLKEIHRIQALTDVENTAAHRVLDKTGFTKEGVIRNIIYMRGKRRDGLLYSITREDWGHPKILTRD